MRLTGLRTSRLGIAAGPAAMTAALPGARLVRATLGFSVVAAAIAGLTALAGVGPASALAALAAGAFGDGYALSETIVQSAPLAIIAIGVAPAVRAGVFTLGSEGQLIAGAAAATAAVLALGPGAGMALLPIGIAAGMLGGLAYALPPAWLRVRFSVNEALSTLLLNYIAGFALTFALKTGLAAHQTVATPHSDPLPDAALIPKIVEGTRLHAGVMVALVAALALGAWLRSPSGAVYGLFGGHRPLAARLGLSETRCVITTMAISGAMAGLVGWMQVAGLTGTLYPSVSGGLGFTGILVAVLGNLRPLGILATALVIGALTTGAQGLQIDAGAPASLATVAQGLLLIVAALTFRRSAP